MDTYGNGKLNKMTLTKIVHPKINLYLISSRNKLSFNANRSLIKHLFVKSPQFMKTILCSHSLAQYNAPVADIRKTCQTLQ